MEDKRFEIFYIRHAATQGGTFADRSECDIDLSPLGEKQILLLGERYAGLSFDAVFSSPLVRCIKTAAAVAEKLDGRAEIEVMPELVENGTVPGYPGADMDYLSRYYDKLRLCKDRVYGDENGLAPNNTDELNDARSKLLVDYFKSRFTYGQKILVVAHGSLGNHFIPAAVGMPPGDYILSIDNTSVSKIKYTPDGKQRISFLNSTEHLRGIMPDFDFTV